MIQTRVTCWHRITRTFVPRQSEILYVNASVETVVSYRIAHFHTFYTIKGYIIDLSNRDALSNKNPLRTLLIILSRLRHPNLMATLFFLKPSSVTSVPRWPRTYTSVTQQSRAQKPRSVESYILCSPKNTAKFCFILF